MNGIQDGTETEMVKLRIRKETLELLRQQADNGVMVGQERALPAGWWQIEVDEEVFNALSGIDADMDRAIEIACTHKTGRN
jgi:hypothetical protein